MKDKVLAWIKNRGETSTSKCDKANNTFTVEEYNKLLSGMQVLRNIAWNHAIEYRFDPTMSRAHEEYLDLANNILRDYER